MDDRTWEKLRRRARFQKFLKIGNWVVAGLNTPLVCWDALRGHWGQALWSAFVVILCVAAASAHIPLVTIEEAPDGDL